VSCLGEGEGVAECDTGPGVVVLSLQQELPRHSGLCSCGMVARLVVFGPCIVHRLGMQVACGALQSWEEGQRCCAVYRQAHVAGGAGAAPQQHLGSHQVPPTCVSRGWTVHMYAWSSALRSGLCRKATLMVVVLCLPPGFCCGTNQPIDLVGDAQLRPVVVTGMCVQGSMLLGSTYPSQAWCWGRGFPMYASMCAHACCKDFLGNTKTWCCTAAAFMPCGAPATVLSELWLLLEHTSGTCGRMQAAKRWHSWHCGCVVT
jgi:hypothetical protein